MNRPAGATRYESFGKALYDGAWRLESTVRRLKDRRLDIDGFPIAYYDGGAADGPPVVLLHGFSADRTVWIRFAGHLLRRHRVLIPDLPGHGRTPFHPHANYSGPAQASRVISLLDHLDIEKAHICGNSMGGFIAATAAIEHGDRLLTLGLTDAAGISEPRPGSATRSIERGAIPFFLDSPAQFGPFYASTMARPPFTPHPVRAALARDYVTRNASLREMWGDFHGQFWLDHKLDRITVPTYIFWGAKDQLVDVSAARKWQDGVHDAELTVYDDLGHMPMLERPRRAAHGYRDFLTRH